MKNKQKIKQEKKNRRHQRVRSRIKGVIERPRLSVFRSNTQIYIQLINDKKGYTLVAADSLEIKKMQKKENNIKNGLSRKMTDAYEVGKLIAQKALEKNIKQVVFDRGGYKYHGRVKAVADGAREGGLQF